MILADGVTEIREFSAPPDMAARVVAFRQRRPYEPRRAVMPPSMRLGTSRAFARRMVREAKRQWKRKTGLRYVPPDVEYPLSDAQADVFDDHARFRVLIAGRRFGKTYLACVELIAAAMERPRSNCWYVAPTYRMAKDIAWDMLKDLVPESWRAGKPNESSLTIRLKNGSRISLKGAEKPDRLRGRDLWLVVLDEFPMMIAKVWAEAIRPSLGTSRGSCLFIGTPMGFNWAYDLFLLGMEREKNPQWRSWQYTTVDGDRVTDDELTDAKAILDPRVYRQEFEASFETLAGRVYNLFTRKLHVAIEAVEARLVDDPGDVEILVGMDFNVNPMTAVLAWRCIDAHGKIWCHIFDVLEIMDSNTDEMAKALRARFPRSVQDKRTGEKRPGRRVIIFPDPHVGRHASAAIGETDHTILERHGFVVDPPEHELTVRDRINNTQANLKNAAGESHIRVHPRCKALIKAWDGLTYKEGTNEPNKKLGLDHVCDAADYMLWQRFNRLNAYRLGISKRRI